MNKTIAITGASGFIGNYLKNYFREKGYTVIALLRRNVNDDQGTQNFNLETPDLITPSLFENVEIVIHCAFVKDRNKDGTDPNVTGTKAMIEAAKKAGVKKFIFFSTTTAHEGAASFYAKSKLIVEKLFDEHDVILKCGLVIGNGGLFKQMLSFALAKKIVPIIKSGSQAVQFISLDSVALAIEHILQTNASGTYVLAQPQSTTYKQLFLIIKKYFGVKLIFVPIPFLFLKTILSVTEKLNIRLPVTKENLLGLKAMKAWQNFQDVETLQLPNEKFEELLKEYFPQQTISPHQ